MITSRLLLITGVLASVLLAQPASADIVLPQKCQMGQCGDSKFIRKDLLREGPNGALYSVKLASRSWQMDSEPPANFGQPEVNYVYCSTTRPSRIFKDGAIYYAHLLNPGGDWFGYNASDYPVYWATCHNFVGPDFFSEEMTSRAIKLGYPLNLPSDQIELSNVLEIMN